MSQNEASSFRKQHFVKKENRRPINTPTAAPCRTAADSIICNNIYIIFTGLLFAFVAEVVVEYVVRCGE